MRIFGFSTGALDKGDFRKALRRLEAFPTTAVELSALRCSELPELAEALRDPSFLHSIERYAYRSIHAPSKLQGATERQVVDLLRPCFEAGFHVVVHPDAIHDYALWREFGELVCVENNDARKPGRTVEELAPVFDELPCASWCLDLAHGRQIDATMLEVWRMLRAFGDRLAQIHLSELNSKCQHEPLSMASVRAISEISQQIPDAPVILESVVEPDRIGAELAMAEKCFVAPPPEVAAAHCA